MMEFEFGSHERKTHFLTNVFILHIHKSLNYSLVFRLAKNNKYNRFNGIAMTTGS